jgi:hypothetical protein
MLLPRHPTCDKRKSVKVILVTGSRSFEGHGQVPLDTALRDEAKNWLLTKLFESAIGTSRVLILSGEAKGPDLWSLEFVQRRAEVARILGTECRYVHECYSCDGMAVQFPTDKAWRWSSGRVHPKDRNTKLVEVAAAMRRDNEVTVLGLIDRRSPTAGTMDTIGKAKEAEITGTFRKFG